MIIALGIVIGLSVGIFLVKTVMRAPATSKHSVCGPVDHSLSYAKFQADLDKENYKNNQIFEDMEMARKIFDEAFRLYEEWSNSPELTDMEGKKHKGGIVLVNPYALSYVIYDSETAKYAKADLQNLVIEEFEKLKIEIA